MQSDVRVMDWLCSSMDDVIRIGESAGVSCSDCIADNLPGMASNGMYLELECNWNGLEWPGTTAMPNRCTKISAGTGTGTVIVTVSGTVTVTVTVPGTVTVTVPVTRLGTLGSGCASCGLLYGYCETRRVEGWLSMLLRQGRLYIFRNKLMLSVPLLFKSR